MRTMLIILGGFVLLGFALLVARWIGGAGRQATVTVTKLFIVIWLALAVLNMWIGVSRAGYSVAEELPIFLLIFLLPAGAALFMWWRFSR